MARWAARRPAAIAIAILVVAAVFSAALWGLRMHQSEEFELYVHRVALARFEAQADQQARAIQFQSPGDAAELYAQVLASDPENVEALTYRGWTLALNAVQAGGASGGTGGDTSDDVVAELRDAVDSLRKATDLDPTYPDPKCFLGIVNFRILRQPEAAQPWVEGCLAANPPADIRDLVQSLNEEIAAALAPTTTP